MRVFSAVLAAAGVFLLVVSGARAAPSAADARECLRYVEGTERYWGIPRGMLRAIGFVESGHNGTVWPWTLNIDGAPYYLPDRETAIRKMAAADGKMHRDMAVGCMQIFVRYHEDWFKKPAEMIDPKNNVWYAGWYLRSLYEKHGSWTAAVARYHSSKQEYQIQYLCRVVAARVKLGYQRPTAWYLASCR